MRYKSRASLPFFIIFMLVLNLFIVFGFNFTVQGVYIDSTVDDWSCISDFNDNIVRDSDGKLYFAYVSDDVSGYPQTYMKTSDDDGVTWSSPITLSYGATITPHVYPCIAIDEHDHVTVAWLTGQGGAANRDFLYIYNYSASCQHMIRDWNWQHFPLNSIYTIDLVYNDVSNLWYIGYMWDNGTIQELNLVSFGNCADIFAEASTRIICRDMGYPVTLRLDVDTNGTVLCGYIDVDHPTWYYNITMYDPPTGVIEDAFIESNTVSGDFCVQDDQSLSIVTKRSNGSLYIYKSNEHYDAPVINPHSKVGKYIHLSDNAEHHRPKIYSVNGDKANILVDSDHDNEWYYWWFDSDEMSTWSSTYNSAFDFNRVGSFGKSQFYNCQMNESGFHYYFVNDEGGSHTLQFFTNGTVTYDTGGTQAPGGGGQEEGNEESDASHIGCDYIAGYSEIGVLDSTDNAYSYDKRVIGARAELPFDTKVYAIDILIYYLGHIDTSNDNLIGSFDDYSAYINGQFFSYADCVNVFEDNTDIYYMRFINTDGYSISANFNIEFKRASWLPAFPMWSFYTVEENLYSAKVHSRSESVSGDLDFLYDEDISYRFWYTQQTEYDYDTGPGTITIDNEGVTQQNRTLKVQVYNDKDAGYRVEVLNDNDVVVYGKQLTSGGDFSFNFPLLDIFGVGDFKIKVTDIVNNDITWDNFTVSADDAQSDDWMEEVKIIYPVLRVGEWCDIFVSGYDNWRYRLSLSSSYSSSPGDSQWIYIDGNGSFQDIQDAFFIPSANNFVITMYAMQITVPPGHNWTVVDSINVVATSTGFYDLIPYDSHFIRHSYEIGEGITFSGYQFYDGYSYLVIKAENYIKTYDLSSGYFNIPFEFEISGSHEVYIMSNGRIQHWSYRSFRIFEPGESTSVNFLIGLMLCLGVACIGAYVSEGQGGIAFSGGFLGCAFLFSIPGLPYGLTMFPPIILFLTGLALIGFFIFMVKR